MIRQGRAYHAWRSRTRVLTPDKHGLGVSGDNDQLVAIAATRQLELVNDGSTLDC
jgi:hypothetical protein